MCALPSGPMVWVWQKRGKKCEGKSSFQLKQGHKRKFWQIILENDCVKYENMESTRRK